MGIEEETHGEIRGSELAREGPQGGPKAIPHDLQLDDIPDSAPD